MTEPQSDGATVTPTTLNENIDIGRVFSFFFEDANWLSKLLIGSLFALLTPALVGTVFITGFAVRIARKALRGEQPLLPEWDDLAGIFVDGVKGVAVYLGHVMPLVVLIFLLALAVGGSSILLDSQDGIPEEFQAFAILTVAFGALVFFIGFLAVLVYVPASFARFVRTDRLGAAFDFRENLDFIRANASEYSMGLLAILLAGLVSQFGILLFCIGIFPATFWSTCAMGFVIGELCRLDERKKVS